MTNLFQILDQFVMFFPKNLVEKSLMNWRVLSPVKINTRISYTPCISYEFTLTFIFLIKDY
jgi:hypothetical protein